MNCKICKCVLNDSSSPATKDCGGDCLACVAAAGDPDCIKALEEIMRSEYDFSNGVRGKYK